MQSTGYLASFAPCTFLPRPPVPQRTQCTRAPPVAKKAGSGKKRGKSSRSKRVSPPRTSKPAQSAAAPASSAQPPPSSSPQNLYPGPLAPDLLPDVDADTPLPAVDVDTAPVDGDSPAVDAEIAVADELPFPADPPIPVADEAKLRLPDLAASGKGVKRKRKPRAVKGEFQQPAEDRSPESKETLPTDKIRELTAAYRSGGKEAEMLINEIEKDPDYMFQTGNPDGEYDLAAAIIGTGSPNKQGVYVLPYLQSGHLLLLLVVLLCAFVYYPGFPLTELDESLRTLLKRGLVLTYAFNGALAVLAYRDAKKRGQPASFWALKTAFLGNIAFSELRRNAPLQKEGSE